MSLSVDLQKFAEKAIGGIEARRRAVLFKLMSAIVRDTPVDTGTLRSNWQTSLGAPAEGMVGNRGEASVLAEMQATLSRLSGDVPLFFRNNLPYALPIEYGHSKQAPQGMVRKNVARFERLMGGGE